MTRKSAVSKYSEEDFYCVCLDWEKNSHLVNYIETYLGEIWVWSVGFNFRTEIQVRIECLNDLLSANIS